MHVGNLAKGMLPAIAIVGGSIPVAAGMGLAFKMQKTRQVVACFFGDGATSEGAFHEGVNLAAVWNLPVVFACENNRYGASTHVTKVTRLAYVAERAAGYGIRGETVDGNNVIAVYEAARQAVTECREGRGPVLLELLTYRITGHSRRDSCQYQPDEERKLALENEPIGRFARTLLSRGVADRNKLDAIGREVEARIDAAISAAKAAPDPKPEDALDDLFVEPI